VEVKKSTETGLALALDKLTVKVAFVDPLLPSVTVTSLIDSEGGTTVNEVLDELLPAAGPSSWWQSRRCC
jgi:hypothetical protein